MSTMRHIVASFQIQNWTRQDVFVGNVDLISFKFTLGLLCVLSLDLKFLLSGINFFVGKVNINGTDWHRYRIFSLSFLADIPAVLQIQNHENKSQLNRAICFSCARLLYKLLDWIAAVADGDDYDESSLMMMMMIQ